MDKQSKSVVPNEIRGWNWGAFTHNIRWGIGNKTYLPLLCLIPIFNIFWIFVCGFKGNEWAWKNGDYEDTKTFLAVQGTWIRSGFICFIVSVVIIGFALISIMNKYSTI